MCMQYSQVSASSLLAVKGFNSSAGCLIDLLLMGRSAAADAAERV